MRELIRILKELAEYYYPLYEELCEHYYPIYEYIRDIFRYYFCP